MFNRWSRNGDEAARQQCLSWFRTARHRLYLYALRRAGQASDVELLLSRTMERVADAVYYGRVPADEESLLPYTLRALSNEAIKMGLIERRRLHAEARYINSLPSHVSSDSHHSSDLQQKLAACVTLLPENQAEVVILHIWQELSFAEIGRMLGVGESTVRMRYEAALRKMKQMVKDL